MDFSRKNGWPLTMASQPSTQYSVRFPRSVLLFPILNTITLYIYAKLSLGVHNERNKKNYYFDHLEQPMIFLHNISYKTFEKPYV